MLEKVREAIVISAIDFRMLQRCIGQLQIVNVIRPTNLPSHFL